MPSVRFEELQPSDLTAILEQAPVAYFPIGSIEYHGFHLPFGFDTFHAHALCLDAAQQTGGAVLPPTFWGFRGHVGFPGSLLLREETIAALARDVLEQVTDQGFRLIVILTGHWPDVQGEMLRGVAAEHMAAHPDIRVIVCDPFNLHPTDRPIEHAGLVETSAMLNLRPDLVAMAKLQEPGALHAIQENCVDATAEKGRERYEVVLGELVRLVRASL